MKTEYPQANQGWFSLIAHSIIVRYPSKRFMGCPAASLRTPMGGGKHLICNNIKNCQYAALPAVTEKAHQTAYFGFVQSVLGFLMVCQI